MIAEILGIIDRLIKVTELREKRSEKLFKDLINPIFEDLERIHADYNMLLNETQKLIPVKPTVYSIFNDNASGDQLIESLYTFSHLNRHE